MNPERSFTREDASLISKHAEQLLFVSDSESEIGDALLEMIGQATILPEGERAKDHVELNDVVTYEVVATGATLTVTLVEPREAEPRAGRVSLFTPVGLALLGVRIGEASSVQLPSGKAQTVRVLAAEPQLLPAA